MQMFNDFFKGLAGNMGLPSFFEGNTLLFNNLFLALLAAVSLIGLLLVAFLVPGKKRTS